MNLNHQSHGTALESYSRKSVRTARPSQSGFHDLGIAPSLTKAINRLNFENPTPVQKEAIPIGIRGDDIVAVAQTGSGKTLAFGIPMLQRLSKSKRSIGLVVVPTRELAIQVEESLQPICRPLNFRSVVLIGGASISLQKSDLLKNPRIIIATPGRLMDHIDRKTVDLSTTSVFILDEADRMLDMGFVPDIRKITKSIPSQRQTMMFSATMPQEVEDIAQSLMEDPTRIEIDRSGATPAEVSHEMFIIKNQEKSRLLAVQLKQCSGPVLVFTRTKWMARKLTTKVNKMGFATAQIHSNRSLTQRRDALEGFKQRKYQILIATDIAARGIDVSGIELVVNYDMPATSEDYVHRIGRTGRAGKTGHAISFATSDQRGSIRSIEKFMKTEMMISALPTLPSEKLLLKEGDQLRSKSEPSRDEIPSRRKPSGDRMSKRYGFRRNGSSKSTKRRIKSKQSDSKETGPSSQESGRKVSIPQTSQPAGSGAKSGKKESPFWMNFKKHWPARKKSAGQDSRRKKHARRK